MTGSLYLSPNDPWGTPPPAQAVVAALTELQMIGPPHGEATWLAGDALLRHITFAGCSPYLALTPPPDGGTDFCHVALLGPSAQPRIITGPNTLNPRCPTCKARVKDWAPLAERFDADPAAPWTCPSCNAGHRIDTLRWRQHAAFGRLLVEIRSVFPAEGVPSDELLETLGKACGMDSWQFAWAASSA